jgi:3-oxoacyl-[acyl-carrier protein] reductase
MPTRTATAQWKGSVADGDGTIALANGSFRGPYSWRSRFAQDTGTNPEELIAAGAVSKHSAPSARSSSKRNSLSRGSPMLLENKTAIIYGAGGAIGSAVTRAYAREGATVHLAGRSARPLEQVADRVRDAGATAYVATVDVLDPEALVRHAANVIDLSGSIDICFNAISNDDIQGRTLLDMPLEDVLQPVTKSLTAHFNIATTVARHMARGSGGVILVMGGGREAIPRLGGSHVAWAALAGLSRQLAADLGPHNIRVAWILSPGSPDLVPDHHPSGSPADAPQADAKTKGLIPGHQPTYENVGSIAAFLASDAARTMTATEINLTGGAVID